MRKGILFSGVDGGCNRIRRGRPTCRPVGGFREETFPGGHIGPPLRGGERFPQPTRPSCAEASATGRDRARPPQGNQSRAVYGGVKSPRPMEATQVVPSEGPKWASAPTDRKRDLCDHLGQRRTAERLRQRVRGNGWESEQGSSPTGSATSDNPSVSLRLTAPFAQGSLGDGGWGSPRRPVGPPRNDNRFLSFRGAERRGNPSFLRWTGVRAAVPRAWPPPTKFRPEIWGVGQVVGPCGKPNQRPKPAGAQRSARARGREGWAGLGAKAIPKGGLPRDCRGSA